MPTIAVALQAGGVGKTFVTYNLGATLAARGKRVLIVDADGQVNLTEACNVHYDPEKTLFQLLTTARADSPTQRVTARDAIVPVPIREHLHLLPGSPMMSKFDTAVAALDHREYLLQEALEAVEGYDFILIDCPPGLGMVLTNALYAADQVVIPVQTRRRRAYALPVFVKVLATVLKKRPNLRVAGIVPNQYDRRNSHDEEVLGYIKRFGDKYGFRTLDPIPVSTRVNDADNARLPLSDYEHTKLKGPLSGAVDALETLADEILSGRTLDETETQAPAIAAS
jgi:chromosome partitioning protein